MQASSPFENQYELKFLIDESHCLGLFVLTNTVHLFKNANDNVNMFDC